MIAVSPLDAAIAAHRAAYDAFQVAPASDDDPEAQDANCAMLDAMDALVVAATAFPILTRPLPSGAGALLAHLRWWLAEEAGQADSYQPAYSILAGRAADLAAVLEPPAVDRDDPVVAAIVANDMATAAVSAALVHRDEDDDEGEALIEAGYRAVDAAFAAVRGAMPATLAGLLVLVKFYERDQKIYDRCSSGGDYFEHVAAALGLIIAREKQPALPLTAAPIRETKGVPGQPEILAAWLALPPAERDRIGFLAVDMAAQSFIAGHAYSGTDRPVPGDDKASWAIREAADTACNDRLTEIHRVIEAAIPDLFGPAGENPDWAVAMGARR